MKIENLTKKYDSFAALDSLNLEVNEGEVIGFLGPNGAGKTTAIRLILELIKPTNGSVYVFGLDSQKDKVAASNWDTTAISAGLGLVWAHLVSICLINATL